MAYPRGFPFCDTKFIFFIMNNNISSCCTVLPAKSDSDFMICLQSYRGLIIDRSLVY